MLLVDRLIEVLKTYNLCDIDTESYCQFPIKLQSFNETMLKKLSEKINLPLYHLFGDETNIC